MQYTYGKFQRGQAMSELIAAMALFLPLVFGVIYAGKYADIKHQTIQASRYAAFERALDPRAHESDGIVQNETVARFFRDAGQHLIGLNDQAQGATAGDENANWSMVSGNPLLAKYSDVTVNLTGKSYDSNLLKDVDLASQQFSGLHTGYGNEAEVKVAVANVTHFAPLSAINLTIGASTVMAGDPWNGGGTHDVAHHFTEASVAGKQPQYFALEAVLEPYIVALNDTVLPPQFGCVKPDVVPDAATNGSQYDPTDNPVSPSNPNDKCL